MINYNLACARTDDTIHLYKNEYMKGVPYDTKLIQFS